MYVALQNMEVSSGRQVKAGDTVPEAITWPNLRSWVNRGHLAFVPDGQEAAFVAALRAGGDAAVSFAPMSQPHHIAGAVRRMQYGAEAQQQPSPSLEAATSAPAANPEPVATPAPPAPQHPQQFGKRKDGR